MRPSLPKKLISALLAFRRVPGGFVIWLTAALFSPAAFAQSQLTTFVPVGPKELSSTFVRCVYKDSKGFMWFGTATGLPRYDGTNLYRYEHGRGSTNTITDNRINAIVEDGNNNLWIGTAQGLVIYDRERDNFQNVDSIAGNTNYINNGISRRYVPTTRVECGLQRMARA